MYDIFEGFIGRICEVLISLTYGRHPAIRKKDYKIGGYDLVLNVVVT